MVNFFSSLFSAVTIVYTTTTAATTHFDSLSEVEVLNSFNKTDRDQSITVWLSHEFLKQVEVSDSLIQSNHTVSHTLSEVEAP